MGIKKLNRRRKRNNQKKERLQYSKKVIHQQEKEIFDLKQLLEISKSLNSVLDFNRLIESILYVVMAQMRTFGVAIFIKKSFDDDSFVLHNDFYGFDVSHANKYYVPDNHKIIEFFTEAKGCLFPDELESIDDKNDPVIDLLLGLSPTLFVPLKAKNRLVGFLLLGKQMDKDKYYDQYEQNIISNIASLAAIAINNAQLLEMTTTDIMTRLKLKHYFYAVLAEKVEALENFQNLSILMLDIDNFKKVNDTYGHACGDIVLQQVAKIILDSVRQTDLAARYGGEEFVALLNDADCETASAIAERIRSRVENMEIIYDDLSIKVTISIGVSEYLHNGESIKNLVNRADVALYESKSAGKNRYTISKENLDQQKKDEN